MKRIKETVLRLLRPGAVWTILLIIISAAALAYAFINGIDTSLIAIIAYVLSAYTLVVLSALIASGGIQRAKAFIYKNKHIRRYMTDMVFRARISLYASLAINLIYSVFQLGAGIHYSSFWYGAVAVYYIVVCGVRFVLLRHFRKETQDPERELRAYRFCGLMLFALNAAVVGMVVQMVRDGQGARYPGLMIYTMATYAFYRITISIINVVKYRKLHSPVLSATKALNLATALMAIFSLETAMLAEFGGAGNFERMMNTAIGGSVCLFIFCMAIFMIRRSNKELRKLRINNSQA